RDDARVSLLAPTLSWLLLRTDALLQRESEVAAGVRDRMHGGARSGHRRDARDAGGERRLADQVATRARAGPAEGRVHDEVAVAPAHEVDDSRPLPRLGDLAHVLDRAARRGQRCVGPPGCE